MNSCSVSDLPWLWFLITENLIFVFLWKFSPKQVLHVFKILKVQWSHFLKLEKRKDVPVYENTGKNITILKIC